MSETNSHHVLFYRRDWTARVDSKKLRQNRWLQPRLDVEAHRALHREVTYVPTLGMYALALVRRDFIPIKDDYEGSAHALIETINEARCERTTPLEIEASQLVIRAIEAQLPYIQEAVYEQ